jgi:hypothetical protein
MDAHEPSAAPPAKPKSANLSRAIGMTMAGLGVVLAFCSAMVGNSRNSMISTMVKQTDASNKYLTVATKYRLIESQLQEMHALLPTDAEAMKKAEQEFDALEERARRTPNEPVLKGIHLETAQILNGAIPTRADVLRFADMVETYAAEKEAARERAESFDGKVEAYEESTEHYELAQVMAEIGIVLASVALLLSQRLIWIVALLIGMGSLGTIGWTTVGSKKQLAAAEATISNAEARFQKASQEKADEQFDAKLEEDVETMPKW